MQRFPLKQKRIRCSYWKLHYYVPIYNTGQSTNPSFLFSKKVLQKFKVSPDLPNTNIHSWKNWTRIGAPYTSMQKQSNVIPLINKRRTASTRVAWMHRWRKIPGLWLNWTQSAIWRLAAPCWAQARQRAIASHAARTAAVCLLVCARAGPHTHIYGPLANKTATRTPLSLFNLTDRSRKNFRLFVPVPIRDIPGALSALRDCCLCVCVCVSP